MDDLCLRFQNGIEVSTSIYNAARCSSVLFNALRDGTVEATRMLNVPIDTLPESAARLADLFLPPTFQRLAPIVAFDVFDPSHRELVRLVAYFDVEVGIEWLKQLPCAKLPKHPITHDELIIVYDFVDEFSFTPRGIDRLYERELQRITVQDDVVAARYFALVAWASSEKDTKLHRHVGELVLDYVREKLRAGSASVTLGAF